MILRIAVSFLLLISIFNLPFYLSVIILLGAMFYFSFYVEGVFIFLLSDLLFGAPEAKLWNIVLLSFFVALASLIILEFVKTKLRFQTK